MRIHVSTFKMRLTKTGYPLQGGVYPVVYPEDLGFEHYSDPCLFSGNNNLFLLFRRGGRRRPIEGTAERLKKDQLYMIHSDDGIRWSVPELVIEKRGDELISPSVVYDEKHMFCIESEEVNGVKSTKIVRYEISNDITFVNRVECGVTGLDQDYFVWHIDVEKCQNGKIRGLFMLQKRNLSAIISKLALFTLDAENVWHWERDISQTQEENKQISFIYRSTFTDSENKILCSACDRRLRFFLFEKEI